MMKIAVAVMVLATSAFGAVGLKLVDSVGAPDVLDVPPPVGGTFSVDVIINASANEQLAGMGFFLKTTQGGSDVSGLLRISTRSLPLQVLDDSLPKLDSAFSNAQVTNNTAAGQFGGTLKPENRYNLGGITRGTEPPDSLWANGEKVMGLTFTVLADITAPTTIQIVRGTWNDPSGDVSYPYNTLGAYNIVPEPVSMMLLAAGAAFFARRRRA